MRNILVGSLLFLATPSFAMRGSGGGGGASSTSSTDIYNATNTAGFPAGLTASTITTTGDVQMGGSGVSNLFGYPLRILTGFSKAASIGVTDSGLNIGGSSWDLYSNNVDVLNSLNGTNLTSAVPWIFGGYNCSGNTNSGKLTVDGSGNVACADDISGGGDSASVWPLAVGTGTAANFTNIVSSPAAAISFEGTQFKSVALGSTNYIYIDTTSLTGMVSKSSATTNFVNKLNNYVAVANTDASMRGGSAGSPGASLTFGVDSASAAVKNNGLIRNSEIDSSSVTKYGTSIPAAAIASGVLGSAVIASSVGASGVTPASYGSATQSPSLTVGVDGRLTAASNVTITPAAGSITAGALLNTVIASSLAVVGVSGTYGSASISPTITFNAQGQVTSASSNTISAAGDNLGNHTATQNLSMASKAISNIGTTNSFFDSGGGLTANSSVTFAGGISIKGVAQAADYTATINDAIILSSSTAGTTRYITLPALILTSSQTVKVVKDDLSGNPVVVRISIGTGDLINGTTKQIWMYAPGQSVSLYADKNTGSWWTTGRAPTTPPTIGAVGNDPNSAAAVVATTTYCHAEYVPDFAVMYGMGFNVGTQSTSSNFQIAAYDNYGVLIGTSAYTPLPGNTIQVRNFMNPVYLAPGTVWLCFGSNAGILQISRRSTGANDMGTCSFATSVPFAAKQTFAGCSHTGNDYAFFGLVSGGIIP